MSNIRDRFRSLDRQAAPDLWSDATARADAARPETWRPGPRWAVVAVAMVVLVVLVASQVVGRPLIVGPGASASPSADASPDPSVEPSLAPSLAPTPSPDEYEFFCDQEMTLDASFDHGREGLTDVQVTGYDGFDVVEFWFPGDEYPGYVVRPAHSPFSTIPGGLPLDVAGTSVYEIVLTGASKSDASGALTYTGPTDIRPDGLEQVVQVVEAGDFEGVNTWFLGLNGGECLTVGVGRTPEFGMRIMVLVQH